MKITDFQVFEIHAGWRSWLFVRVSADTLEGWSEISDSNTCNLATISFLRSTKEVIVGTDVDNYLHTLHLLGSLFIQNIQFSALKPLAGIENAFIDLFCKANKISAIKYLKGFPKNSVPIYWSHFGTTRCRAYNVCDLPQLLQRSDILPVLDHAASLGIQTIKSNIIVFDQLNNSSFVFMPGSFKGYNTNYKFPSQYDYSRAVQSIASWIDYIRHNSELNIAIDLNFNLPSSYFPLLSTRAAWYEFDVIDISTTAAHSSHFPKSLNLVTGENSLTYDTFRYLIKSPVPVLSLDPCWLGSSRTIQFVSLAEKAGKSITIHNFNGHLSTYIALSHCSIVNNLHFLEVDLDDVPWKDSIFSSTPCIVNGYIEYDDNSFGWGCDLLLDNAHEYIIN